MKNYLKYILILVSTSTFACGGGAWEGMAFYNLFMQTNISAEEFHPFLRDESSTFYGDNAAYYEGEDEKIINFGNIKLWREIQNTWSNSDIQKAVYNFNKFDWTNKNSLLDVQMKTYLSFAQECSQIFEYRYQSTSWDYDEVLAKKNINTEELLAKANMLLDGETNIQLRARYYYQIVRILHYTQDWKEAIQFFETKVKGKIPQHEIYYYILDQVAGCYYSIENYEKAAYLFTKVLNKSIDRKKSAFVSYNFCASNGAEGKSFFNGPEDEMDLLLIKSLRDFSDEISNIQTFISLNANDKRVELLFMRALSNLEREVWPKIFYFSDQNIQLPTDKKQTYKDDLLKIAERQLTKSNIKNRDFWQISCSYLHFINQDIQSAKAKLEGVHSFEEQKTRLLAIYDVFTWKTISTENENYLAKISKEETPKDDEVWNPYDTQNEWKALIQAKVAHTYYKNNQIAKAFLVHNKKEVVQNLGSLELLDALEKFYLQPIKNEYENILLGNQNNVDENIDYINYQRGIYYLHHQNPVLALTFFEKNQNYVDNVSIPSYVFSNNIMECFRCDQEIVMDDEVFKADVFSFIKDSFNIKQLTENLIELETLRSNEKQWKAKLANYLIANYYFNISNTGYYRGILNGSGNCCDYDYIHYPNQYSSPKIGENIIAKRSGYNLSNISFFKKKYFSLNDISIKYYQNVIDLSTDKELNARCLYIMAKCELNKYYNEGEEEYETFTMNSDYGKIPLPKSKSYAILKNEYSETNFHKMILLECSYYRYYYAH